MLGEGEKLPESNWTLSSPGYFAAMHIPLFSGRDFTPQDQYGTPGIVIISESAARQSFPGENPIGRQLLCGLDEAAMKPMTIVGVVGDVRQDSPGSPPQPTLYMPMEQHPYHSNELQVIVRTSSAPAAMTSAVRKAAYELNPEMAVRFTTMEEMISDSTSRSPLPDVSGGHLRAAGSAVGDGGDLWRHELRCHPADLGIGAAHGAGRGPRGRHRLGPLTCRGAGGHRGCLSAPDCRWGCRD